MSKRYFVTCVETVECEACEGAGVVQHPAWARYWKANGDRANMMSAEDDLDGDLPSAAVGFTGDKTDERRFDHDCG